MVRIEMSGKEMVRMEMRRRIWLEQTGDFLN